MSSAGHSSKRFTQDFESNDGVASICGHFEEEAQCAGEKHNQDYQGPMGNVKPEQHYGNNPVDFDNNQGGGVDGLDDES